MKIIKALILLLLVNYVNAQNLENSLLWEISGNGLEHSSYLFGTIHMSCDATLDKDVLNALDKTSLLVLELDMDDASMQGKMLKYMFMKDEKSLKDFLSEEEFTLLGNFYKSELGIDISALSKVKPFFLGAMVYPKLLNCPIQSLENELMKVAHEQEEEVIGLESVEEQMAIFDDIPYEDQIKDLLKSAKDSMKTDRENFDKLLKTYNNEDITALYELTQEDKTLSTSVHADKLLTNRNKNWIPKIIELSQDQPTFFGVGAAHLGGNNGVIELLRNEGFKVKAVK